MVGQLGETGGNGGSGDHGNASFPQLSVGSAPCRDDLSRLSLCRMGMLGTTFHASPASSSICALHACLPISLSLSICLSAYLSSVDPIAFEITTCSAAGEQLPSLQPTLHTSWSRLAGHHTSHCCFIRMMLTSTALIKTLGGT